jgi:hypothetical protein
VRRRQRELFARNFVVPPVEYGYEDQVESGEGITTPRGATLPRPERSEYAIVVRPRGVGVDSDLAAWLTGLHGSVGGEDGNEGGAARGFHRMYVANAWLVPTQVLAAVCCCLLAAVCCWLLLAAGCCWLLAAGCCCCWLLAAGCCCRRRRLAVRGLIPIACRVCSFRFCLQVRCLQAACDAFPSRSVADGRRLLKQVI